ncbi:hypothetical protein NUSPORA_01994 [Nucleospora cyclopteri]
MENEIQKNEKTRAKRVKCSLCKRSNIMNGPFHIFCSKFQNNQIPGDLKAKKFFLYFLWRNLNFKTKKLYENLYLKRKTSVVAIKNTGRKEQYPTSLYFSWLETEIDNFFNENSVTVDKNKLDEFSLKIALRLGIIWNEKQKSKKSR